MEDQDYTVVGDGDKSLVGSEADTLVPGAVQHVHQTGYPSTRRVKKSEAAERQEGEIQRGSLHFFLIIYKRTIPHQEGGQIGVRRHDPHRGSTQLVAGRPRVGEVLL